MATYLVTGGAGFIGSEAVRQLIARGDSVVNFDKLTYAGNLSSLDPVKDSPNYRFVQGDICDATLVAKTLAQHKPDAILHLAAESHVDRSIDGPAEFVHTNVVGTYTMLEESHRYWNQLTGEARSKFRFLHISTDEVYGSLGPTGAFTEETPYAPRSPYSASKAGADHLADAWFHTYGLPVLVSNCSNNYGPYQYPEKMIPLMIINALHGLALPVYGKGENIRDWLHVSDHVRALLLILEKAAPGSSYNVGGGAEMRNIEIVERICSIMDEASPKAASHSSLISFVTDRPGHDFRYAIDSSKIKRELGWSPRETFETGLQSTVKWYLQTRDWWTKIRSKSYSGERLGLARGASGAVEKGNAR